MTNEPTPSEAAGVTSPGLEELVTSWIEKSGHGLEMRVSEALSPTFLGVHYRDTESGKWRETDVLKRVESRDEKVFMYYVIEVKATTATWVLFQGDVALYSEQALVERLYVSSRADQQQHLARAYETPLAFFSGYPAYKVVKFQGTDKQSEGKNEPWEAAMQALSAARGLAAGSNATSADERTSRFDFFVPIVLTSGPLLLAKRTTKGRVSVEKVQKALLVGQFPPDGQQRCVWFVHESYLADLANDANQLPQDLSL